MAKTMNDEDNGKDDFIRENDGIDDGEDERAEEDDSDDNGPSGSRVWSGGCEIFA